MPDPIITPLAATVLTPDSASTSVSIAQKLATAKEGVSATLQQPWIPLTNGATPAPQPPTGQLPEGIAALPLDAGAPVGMPLPDIQAQGVGGVSIASAPMADADYANMLRSTLKMTGINLAYQLTEGNDPAVAQSLIAASALALPTAGIAPAAPAAGKGAAPALQAGTAGKDSIILESREIGEIKSPDCQTARRAAVETYIDKRFGNWEDFTESVKAGHPDFKSFMLALADAMDVATFGVLRPVLLKVTVNPHLKERLVVYQSEYRVAESALPQPEETGGAMAESGRKVERRITQCSRFDIELSKDLYDRFGMDFSQFADSVISAGLADKTVIYSALDEKEIKYAVGSVKGGTQRAEVRNYRRVEGTQDLVARPMTADEYVESEGKLVVDSTLSRLTTHMVEERADAPVTSTVQETPEDVDFGRQTINTTEVSEQTNTKKETIVEQTSERDNITGQITAVDTSGKVITTVSVETTTRNIQATHYQLFGCNTSSVLGENKDITTKTDMEETVTEAPLVVTDENREAPSLKEGEPSATVRREYQGDAIKESIYDDGWITYIPGGSLANLGLKSGLGGTLEWTDYAAGVIDGVLIVGGVAALAAKGGTAVAGAAKVAATAKYAGKAGKVAANLKGAAKAGVKFKPVPKPQSTVFRPRRIPTNHGTWEGSVGNSIWKPNRNFVPKLNNPQAQTMGEIMDQSGITGGGVAFRHNRVNFGPAAEKGMNSLRNHFQSQGLKIAPDIPVTKSIPGFSADRTNNFRLFDRLLEREMKLPEGSVNDTLLRELNLTRHELPGGRMQLVPTALHSNIPHSGGVAEFKYLNAAAN